MISENTSSANEITTAPTPSATSPSPNSCLVITAVSVAAPAATSVFPSRITPRSLSVRASRPKRELRAAHAALCTQTQPITIDGHHRGLGNREEARDDQQHDYPNQKRGNRNVAQIRRREKGGRPEYLAAPRRCQGRRASGALSSDMPDANTGLRLDILNFRLGASGGG